MLSGHPASVSVRLLRGSVVVAMDAEGGAPAIAAAGRADRLTGSEAYFLALVVAVAVFLLRRPDIVTNAQFWAEDGAVWYHDARAMGPGALLVPHTGYLQTISRLVFGAATLLPLLWVPLFANLIGIAIRALTLAFLFTSRFEWIGTGPRLVIATYVLLMPGLSEVHANITNTQWYLALYLLMVLVAAPAAGFWWKLHDFVALIVSGLSGPFVIFLLPTYLIKLIGEAEPGAALRTRLRRAVTPFAVVMLLLALLQAGLILRTADDTRFPAPLGASFLGLAHITVSRIFVGFLGAPNFATDFSRNQAATLIDFALGLVVIAAVLWKGGWQIRGALVFAIVTYALTLAKPEMTVDTPQWPAFSYGGERYFVVVNIIWVCTLVALAALLSRQALRLLPSAAAATALAAACIGGFSIPPLPDFGYPRQVAIFESLPPGTEARLAIQPDGWRMDLVR